jgi:hypothetical protein
MNNRTKYLIVIIFLLICASFIYQKKLINNKELTASTDKKVEIVTKDQNWKTLTDNGFKFSIDYPSYMMTSSFTDQDISVPYVNFKADNGSQLYIDLYVYKQNEAEKIDLKEWLKKSRTLDSKGMKELEKPTESSYEYLFTNDFPNSKFQEMNAYVELKGSVIFEVQLKHEPNGMLTQDEIDMFNKMIKSIKALP